MIHYVPICIILAILGTLLVNPMLYYHLIKQRKEYQKDLEKAKKQEIDLSFISKSRYSIFRGDFPIFLLIGQITVFTITFIFSSWFLYFSFAIVVSWSTILAYMWIPAISQIVTFVVYKCINDSCFPYDVEDNIINTFGIIGIVFFVISVFIGIHKDVYNYLYPYDNITIMESDYAGYPTIDEAALLDKVDLASGSSIYSPIYRNGNWIYPVVNNNSYATSSGYLVVDTSEENITFVAKDIVYSPWIKSAKNVKLVARRFMPSKVLFGNPTFQIEPATGNIFFCIFYGDYACFRAGRDAEGAILIDATTGECISYKMSEIPNWVTGISF